MVHANDCWYMCAHGKAHATHLFLCEFVHIHAALVSQRDLCSLSHPFLLSDTGPYNFCELAHIQLNFIKVDK